MVVSIGYILFIVVTATQARLRTSYGQLRIYHGMGDINSKYPYVVCLKAGFDVPTFILRICTGSLITSNWVLSAAHCLSDTVQYIQYGNMSLPLMLTEWKSKVHKRIKHPRYVEAMTMNDIGLLLVTPVVLNKYGSLSAVDYKILTGYPVEYAGYGQTVLDDTNTGGKIYEFMLDMLRPLQVGEAIVRDCDKDYFGRNLLCLSSKCFNKQTVLPGDSGGPLLYDEKIVGVACAITTDYSAQSFTPISPYLTWIRNIMSYQSTQI